MGPNPGVRHIRRAGTAKVVRDKLRQDESPPPSCHPRLATCLFPLPRHQLITHVQARLGRFLPPRHRGYHPCLAPPPHPVTLCQTSTKRARRARRVDKSDARGSTVQIHLFAPREGAYQIAKHDAAELIQRVFPATEAPVRRETRISMRHKTVARGVLVIQQRTQERGAAVPQARLVLSSILQYLCLSGRLAGDAVMHMTPSRFAYDASLMLPLRQSLDVNKPVHLDTVWMHVLHLILAQLWLGLYLTVGPISYLAFRRHS